MNRRTRKWKFVRQEAKRLAGLGLNLTEIAKRLGLHRSSVSRWVKSGKLRRGRQGAGPVPRTSPAEWATAVRCGYDLDATDEMLVSIGESALLIAVDTTVAAHVRMSAAARFQAIVRQLKLVARVSPALEPPESEKAPPRPPIRRTGGDPRSVLTSDKWTREGGDAGA